MKTKTQRQIRVRKVLVFSLILGALLLYANGFLNDFHCAILLNRYLLTIDAYLCGFALYEMLKEPSGNH